MSRFYNIERRVWILLGTVLLIAFISLGLGVQSLQRSSRDAGIMAQLGEDNRLLHESEQRLRNEIERLRQDSERNSSELKTKEEQLAAAERARLQMEEQRLEKLQREKQKQEFLLSARQKIQAGVAADDASVLLKEQQLTIRLSDKVLFESGKTDLLPMGQAALKNIADFLNGDLKDCPVVVEGHTDNVSISKTLKSRFPSNWELSSARACAAVQYLIEQKVDATRMAAAGRGETQPVVPNDTEEARTKNRRIDIVIDLSKSEMHVVPEKGPAASPSPVKP